MAKRTVKAGVGDSLCNIAYLNGFETAKPFRRRTGERIHRQPRGRSWTHCRAMS
ncbi:MAG: hypothetical protein IPJ30_19735 [Acidobacteria bacterium]|nr:hypothetical protein [Acidobacteriota bacterium]